jgi:peroxiredoxin family protein
MAMSANPPDGGPAKLSLVVFSASYDKVHYALATAAAALSIDIPVTLFFTMGAIRALLAPDQEGSPGWQHLPSEAGRNDGGARNEALKAEGIGDFEELLGACSALGATIMVCEMGLRAEGILASSLRDDIDIAEGGLVTFLRDAAPQGAMLFI